LLTNNQTRTSVFALVLLVSLVLAVQFTDAQDTRVAVGPDPREIPVPPIKTAMKPLPGVDTLPAIKGTPDVLLMNNGTKVTSRAQWRKRHEEMKRILEYYFVGLAPPLPGNVVGREINSQLLLGGKVKYRLVHLTFGPLASRGAVVINYCAQNLRFVPVFGPNALTVTPRVGHIHVRVDDASWVWADASGNPVILMGLSPGPHKVLIELEDANHHTLDQGAIKFVVPETTADTNSSSGEKEHGKSQE
jgi:hypothetical protein